MLNSGGENTEKERSSPSTSAKDSYNGTEANPFGIKFRAVICYLIREVCVKVAVKAFKEYKKANLRYGITGTPSMKSWNDAIWKDHYHSYFGKEYEVIKTQYIGLLLDNGRVVAMNREYYSKDLFEKPQLDGKVDLVLEEFDIYEVLVDLNGNPTKGDKPGLIFFEQYLDFK